MNINESIVALSNSLKDKDWFFGTDIDQYNRIVVYVRWLNTDVMNQVPEILDDHQVLTHFASSKLVKRDDFVTNVSRPVFIVPEERDTIEEVDNDQADQEVVDLLDQITILENICGANVMQSIFYEKHDGNNAVTNLSVKYPQVRESINHLYDKYGFDVLYDLMDF